MDLLLLLANSGRNARWSSVGAVTEGTPFLKASVLQKGRNGHAIDQTIDQTITSPKAPMPSNKATFTKTKSMADGFNEARAMRVAEVMNDFQIIQCRIAQSEESQCVDDYNAPGYRLLRQCRAEARAVLAARYDDGIVPIPGAPAEQEKRHLQRVLLDASARRFQSQKIFLQAMAATRWATTRNQILQGQKPQHFHAASLQQADQMLRMELAAITNEKIVNDFRTKDAQAGHWLQEDPPLHVILNWIGTHQ